MIKKIKEYLTSISPDNEGTHYHWTFMDMAFPTVNLVGKLYKNPSIDDLKELMIKQKREDAASAIRFLLNIKTNDIVIWDAFDINLTFDKVLSNLREEDKFNIISGIINMENRTFKIDNMFFITKYNKKDMLNRFYNNKFISKLNLRGMSK